MSIENITLLSNISTVSPSPAFSYGGKSKGAGYHKNNNGIHTVVYQVENFSGIIKLQGTLELYPGENDWFDIVGTEIGGDSSVIASATKSRTFTGKFVWIRAAYNVQDGTIVEIRYNY